MSSRKSIRIRIALILLGILFLVGASFANLS